VSLDAATEFERLNALRRYAILDTPPEGVFDRITALAADMLDVPVAVVSLVDTNRIWYKSVHGPLSEREMRRLPGLCGAAVAHEGPYVVESAGSDPRTQEHPLVSGDFGLEFYAGVPLRTHDGHALGLLACMDSRPRGLSPRERRFLEGLAAIVMDEIELRRSARQISRLSEALAETCDELERRASFDSLTGVLARSALLTRGAAVLEAAGEKGAAVLMLDVDRFKSINDGFGHAAGDRVLKEVAGRMAASCRAGDLLGRLGGEEFLAIFVGVGPAEARAIAERLREAVERPPIGIGGTASVAATVSGGLVAITATECTAGLTAALERADAALYRAKAGGRNRIATG
jgi:diguanylate cyclase (GGDEF)-like protein